MTEPTPPETGREAALAALDRLDGDIDYPGAVADIEVIRAALSAPTPRHTVGLDLEAIRKRAEAATGGSWRYLPEDNIIDRVGPYEPALFGIQPYTGPVNGERFRTVEQRTANGQFIAHARTDIPLLIAEVERQAAEIESLRAAIAAPSAGAEEPEPVAWMIEIRRAPDREWEGWSVSLDPPPRKQMAAFTAEARVRPLIYGDAPSHEGEVPSRAAPEEPERLRAIIERDRSDVAKATAEMREVFRRHAWLAEGRGSYEWDDDRWHDEFMQVREGIISTMERLDVIARDWTDCPTTTAEVEAARAVRRAAPHEVAGEPETTK